MKRILNLEPDRYDPHARATLEKVGRVDERELTRGEILDQIPRYDALITRLAHQIDREILEAGENLEAVATATTGLDHIDLQAAEELGIEIVSLQGEIGLLTTIRATPEHTWALLLALYRNLPSAHAHAIDGGWERDRFRGRELYGKTLGILGLGRTGKQVARYAQAFDMEVIAHDPYQGEWLDGVTPKDSLEDLAAESDILSLHVPLNDETRGLIDAEVLAALPPGAVVVNTSRGGILDEDALVEALEAGCLGGAALDVVADERGRELRGTRLIRYAAQHDDLLITPHIAGATHESMARTERFIAEVLARHLENSQPTEH